MKSIKNSIYDSNLFFCTRREESPCEKTSEEKKAWCPAKQDFFLRDSGALLRRRGATPVLARGFSAPYVIISILL